MLLCTLLFSEHDESYLAWFLRSPSTGKKDATITKLGWTTCVTSFSKWMSENPILAHNSEEEDKGGGGGVVVDVFVEGVSWHAGMGSKKSRLGVDDDDEGGLLCKFCAGGLLVRGTVVLVEGLRRKVCST